VLRRRLLTELQEKNPGVALTSLQREMAERPSLAKYCTGLARSLGRAAVARYGQQRAQGWSRPVCDTSFATGIASVG
jgi:DICT domain-containing protein